MTFINKRKTRKREIKNENEHDRINEKHAIFEMWNENDYKTFILA